MVLGRMELFNLLSIFNPRKAGSAEDSDFDCRQEGVVELWIDNSVMFHDSHCFILQETKKKTLLRNVAERKRTPEDCGYSESTQ